MLWLLAAALLQDYDVIFEDPDGAADSAVSPDGSTIAFSSRRKSATGGLQGNLDLWLVDVKTKALRQLTKAPENDYEPRFSPDGATIVFSRDRNNNQDLFLVDVKTGDETELTNTPTVEDYPSFSYDSKKIVFTGGPWIDREVHILDLTTKSITRITKGHRLVGAAAFSPDDSTLAYHVYHNSYESGESDLHLVPAAGGEQTKLTDDKIWDYKPTWSWDGAWIAFSSKRDTACFNVWLIRPDGKDLHRVTKFENADARWPNFSRDGRLSFHAITPSKGLLRRVDAVSGDVTDLTSFDGRLSRLIPSPDRTRLVYELNNAVCVFENGATRELAKGTNPQWSPDGKRVAFLRNRTAAIGIADLETGKILRTEGDKPVWTDPQPAGWSPDGAWLATVIDGQITLVDTKEGSKRALTKGDGVREFPAWSADGKSITFSEYHPQVVRYCLSKEPVK